MTVHVQLYEEPNFQGRAALVNACGSYRNLRKIGFPKNALSSLKIGPGVMVELFDHEGFQGQVRRYSGPNHIPSLGDFCRRTGSMRILKTNGEGQSGVTLPSPVGIYGPPPTGLTGQPPVPLTPRPGPVGSAGPAGPAGPAPGAIPSPQFDVSPQLYPAHVGAQPIIVPTGALGATGPISNMYGGRRQGPIVTLYSASNYRGTSVPITQAQNIANITDIGFPSNALTSIRVSPGYVVTLYQGANFTGASKKITGPAQLADLGNFDNAVKSLQITSTSSNLQAASPNWLWWILIIIIIIVILFLIFRH
jgi:hypothetical protein